jgi:hypothetical protein
MVRFADADLAGALRDGDEHDVHDADAADHEGDGGEGEEQHEEAAGDLVPEAGEGVRAEDGEVVRSLIGDLAPPPQ